METKKSRFVILIDNGHGKDTKGKRSPVEPGYPQGGRLLEYKYAREIAVAVHRQLVSLGYDARLLVPETNDVSLTERARRANLICAKECSTNVILISIHCNAAGNGQWLNARGWSAFTSRGTTKADAVANFLYAEAERQFVGQKIRKDMSDGDPDWEEGFYILRKTVCPAVLTENFFQDNKDDVEYLLSAEGRSAIIATHVNGIVNYINAQK